MIEMYHCEIPIDVNQLMGRQREIKKGAYREG